MNLDNLFSYRHLKEEIIDIISQIKELESVMYDPSHPKLDTQPSSTVQTDLSDVLVRYLELQSNYKAKLSLFLKRTDEIDKAIDKLSLRERQIIRCRYIFGMSVSMTAKQENYSERQVMRLTKSGLNNLRKM